MPPALAQATRLRLRSQGRRPWRLSSGAVGVNSSHRTRESRAHVRRRRSCAGSSRRLRSVHGAEHCRRHAMGHRYDRDSSDGCPDGFPIRAHASGCCGSARRWRERILGGHGCGASDILRRGYSHHAACRDRRTRGCARGRPRRQPRRRDARRGSRGSCCVSPHCVSWRHGNIPAIGCAADRIVSYADALHETDTS